MNQTQKAKRDHRGFSLVELLVAVAVLAIVAAPLLHSFITSSATAARSKRLGDATQAGQNVAELVKSKDITGSLAKLQTNDKLGIYTVKGLSAQDYGADGSLSAHTGTNAADQYNLTLTDNKFDAVVTLDSDKYASYNSQQTTKYNEMGTVFDQMAGADPDETSYNSFVLKAKALNASSYALICMRQITLNILEGQTGTAKTCKYSVSYDYTCTANYTDADGGTGSAVWTDHYLYSFYDGTYDGAELPAIYLFFQSYTHASKSASESDILEIDHNRVSDAIPGETPVKVFIACQGETYPATAKAVIRLRDAYFIRRIGADAAKTKIYCNIPKGSYTFKEFYNNYWYISTTYLESLLETSSENRLYDMTVKVYAAGADPSSASPLFTLNSTKLSS